MNEELMATSLPESARTLPINGSLHHGSSLRPTVNRRPMVSPAVWEDPAAVLGYEVDDPYVRRFWTAVLGWGAVADLLRLATAARRGDSLARPVHLDTLARNGLVQSRNGEVSVRPTIPPLSVRHVRLLPPGLRREHASVRWRGRVDVPAA